MVVKAKRKFINATIASIIEIIEAIMNFVGSKVKEIAKKLTLAVKKLYSFFNSIFNTTNKNKKPKATTTTFTEVKPTTSNPKSFTPTFNTYQASPIPKEEAKSILESIDRAAVLIAKVGLEDLTQNDGIKPHYELLKGLLEKKDFTKLNQANEQLDKAIKNEETLKDSIKSLEEMLTKLKSKSNNNI